MIFRRREPVHRLLARQLEPRPVDTRPRWGEVGIHGVARPREWDAVVSVPAELPGEQARFVALPDGTLVIEEGPDDVHQLAEAVERSLEPPYRAEAVRRPEGAWSVAARRIRVADLPELAGDVVRVTATPEGRRLEIDGSPAFGSEPSLERLLDGDGVATALRLDRTLFEVRIDRL